MSRTVHQRAFPLKNVVSIDQFSPALLEAVFATVDDMQTNLRRPAQLPRLADCVVALIFFEPSSRTILSFQAAASRLGAGIIVHQTAEGSSLSKGESLEDTMRIVGGYADVVVLRHKEFGAADRAATACPVPLINGGDGGNEHPTQALVDLYTLRQEISTLSGLRIGMGFDPQHSRSIRSLCRALAQYPDNELILVGPEELSASAEFIQDLELRGARVRQSTDVDSLRKCDVVYLNRFQVERFDSDSVARRFRDQYRISADFVRDSDIRVILDPLPRIHEIEGAVDSLSQAAYFRQAAYGVPVRMALISLLVS